MRIEPKAAFYNEETGAVQPWKDIEVADAVGSELVAEGLAVEIGGGGGGGASAFTVTLAYAEDSKKVKFEATGYDLTYGTISESVIKIGDDYYASTEGFIDAGEYEVLPLFDGGAGYFGTIGDDTMATVTGDASIVFIEDISSYYVKATGPCTITVNYPE